ncbi:PhnA domain-containing protein [Sungkyunkwania multivorans]|uniref:PhnA domain-containing protein n=1 Tax=Sungkyunkwania multivorans TaxID=1173618 RepID=A0ABW3CXR0_9FLAO
MSIERELHKRSGSRCELSGSNEDLVVYQVPYASETGIDAHILISNTCKEQIENPETTDANHWRCLNDSMWSPVPAVQVMAWRMLHRLKVEGWPADLLEMMYLDDDTLNWAKASGDGVEIDEGSLHKDSNGAVLSAGDSVVLIKDLEVKGANFTAKRGTAVRNITLVHDNPEHIEGRISGQRIVILTRYVKKS